RPRDGPVVAVARGANDLGDRRPANLTNDEAPRVRLPGIRLNGRGGRDGHRAGREPRRGGERGETAPRPEVHEPPPWRGKKSAVFSAGGAGVQMRILSILPVSSNEPNPIQPAPKVESSAIMIGSEKSSKKTRMLPSPVRRSRRTRCQTFRPQLTPFVVCRAIFARGARF